MGRLDEELLERVPVVVVRAPVEGVVVAGGKAGVVEDEGRLDAAGFEFEADDGVDTGIPMCGAPGLDDSLIGDELDGAADDEAAELREGSAGSGIDGGGQAREGGELLLVEDGGVKALRGGVEVDLVVDRGAGLIRGGFLVWSGLFVLGAGDVSGGEGCNGGNGMAAGANSVHGTSVGLTGWGRLREG